MENKLYDLENLQQAVDSDEQIPSFIQDFIQTTLDKDLTTLHRSYIQQKKYQTKKMAHQLKFSLYMYGVHSIQKDLEKIELLASSSEIFDQIGPLIKNIQGHLRDVKNQMIEDFKMVITIIE